MITDDEVMRLFERADPARTTDDLDNAPDATGYLAALRQRSNDVTYIHPAENQTDDPGRRPLTLLAVAAAAVVVIVVGALVFAARDDGEGQQVPATVPSPTAVVTPATTPTSTAPAIATVQDPIGRATAFLAAFATGDPATVQALQADDFVTRYSWPNEPLGQPLSDDDWLGLAYQTGHATTYADPTCSLIDDVDGVAEVRCATAMELALHRLTNTEGLGASVTLRVSNDGVVAMESAYARSFGFEVLRPFDEWREANRPDALPDDDNDPQTAAESLEFARTEAALVDEWVTSAVAAVEGTFADHNAGDLVAFLARFDGAADILGVDPTEARDVFAALMADGQNYETSDCVPDGIDRGLAVSCDVVVRPPAHEFSGAEIGGTIRMIVAADGTVVSDGYTVDSQPWIFNGAFEQWLLTEHPDVHARVTWVEIGEHRIPGADDQALVAPYYSEFGAVWSA